MGGIEKEYGKELQEEIKDWTHPIVTEFIFMNTTPWRTAHSMYTIILGLEDFFSEVHPTFKIVKHKHKERGCCCIVVTISDSAFWLKVSSKSIVIVLYY